MPERFTPAERALAEELDHVVQHMVPKGVISTASSEKQDITRLLEILKEVERSYFTNNATAAFRLALEQVDTDIPEQPALYLPGITTRSLMSRLFNLNDSRTYSERHAEIRKELGRGGGQADPKAVQRSISDMRCYLARALLKLEAKAKEGGLPPLPEALDYVPRPALETQFTEAIKKGNRIIALHGDAGTGKTTLARFLAGTLFGSTGRVPTVLAQTEESLHDSLGEVLGRYGREVSTLGWRDRAREFRTLLASDKGPPVVVLDNIDTQAQLDVLVPATPQSRVVVTSRKRLKVKYPHAAAIEVANMEIEEAAKMCGLHVTGLVEEDQHRLARALDCRPLALEHGSACLRNAPYNSDLDAFIDALERNTAAVLESYGDDEDVTLVAIYDLIIRQLAKKPAYVLRALDITILIFATKSLVESMRLVWNSSRNGTTEPRSGLYPEDEALFLKALRILEDWSLVRPHTPFFAMHELTQRILASLRREDIDVVAWSAHENIAERLRIYEWPGGQPVPHGWPDDIDMTLTLIDMQCTRTEIESGGRPDTRRRAQTAALCLRASRQRGEFFQPYYDFAISLLKPPFHESTLSLTRESLELGILHGAPEVLREARSRLPDAHVYESLFSGDFHMLSSRYERDTIFRESEEPNSDERVLDDARRSYAQGVFHYQAAAWAQAEAAYMHSHGLFSAMAEASPEFHICSLECERRLVELFIRRGDIRSAQRQMIVAADRLATLSNEDRSDAVLGLRLRQTESKLGIEVVRGARPESERLKEEIAAYRFLFELFTDFGLTSPALEVMFDISRLTGSLGIPSAGDGFRMLISMFQERGDRPSYLICFAGHLKDLVCNFCVAGRQVSGVAEKALTVADGLAPYSPFWYADSLCLALASAILEKASIQKIQEIRVGAVEATTAIGRPEKVMLAEEVGSGGSPFALFSE